MTFDAAARTALPLCRLQQFEADAQVVRRLVSLKDGGTASTKEDLGVLNGQQIFAESGQPEAASTFTKLWLRRREVLPPTDKQLTVADIFSGCGGLSIGISEAARAVGLSAKHVLAVDTNKAALSVFEANYSDATIMDTPIEEIVDGNLGEPITEREKRIRTAYAEVDIAIGGPPCQGNSDLNNHTRRSDPRNALYLKMARFIEIVRPRFAIIENVPGVLHDRNNVVHNAIIAIQRAGYSVDSGILRADEFGAAQTRRRHILVASREEEVVPSLTETRYNFAQPALSVAAAIDDLRGLQSHETFNTSSVHNRRNQERIHYLFDNELYELPNEERPNCHKLKPHSYKSVYGRMIPTEPAPTITSGFGSTGQGRFVHPFERRTITPHEAARLQGIPDWFYFPEEIKRRALQEMIGNAVPSQLGYAVGVNLFR